MPAWLLIALLALCAALLLAATIGGIVLLVKRRWRGVATCATTVALLASVGMAGVIGLGAKGVRSAWNHTLAPWKRQRDRKHAENAKRWADHIADRKTLADPELLPQAPDEFFTYDGFRDWWRLPLVFPYELGWIDTFESAHLQRYRGGDVRDPNKSSARVEGTPDITQFSFDRRLLIGRLGPTHWEKDRPDSWFIFEFSTAAFSLFESEREMLEAAKTRGFTGELSLKPGEKRFDEYFD